MGRRRHSRRHARRVVDCAGVARVRYARGALHRRPAVAVRGPDATHRRYVLRQRQRIRHPAQQAHPAGGTSSALSQTAGGAAVYDDTFEFRGAKITLQHTSSTSTSLSLISLIDSGTVSKCTFTRQGVGSVACTVHQQSPILVKR